MNAAFWSTLAPGLVVMACAAAETTPRQAAAADPDSRTSPLPEVGSALDADFDAFRALPTTTDAESGHVHEAHEHADANTTPAAHSNHGDAAVACPKHVEVEGSRPGTCPTGSTQQVPKSSPPVPAEAEGVSP